MDEVKGVFEEHQLDYAELKGPTGPLVYPAGFVYIYGALLYLTDQGTNILRAQYIFAGIYVLFIAVVFYVYKLSNTIPPWVLILVCFSRRIHSIFVLRLFNDPIAMLFLYISVAFFVKHKWNWGCLFFSLGVSVKMNIFLFAPGLLLLLVKNFGIIGTIPKLVICAIPQVVLALPFLLTYPKNYLICAFNFGREFFYVWTVNWRLVPEEIFLSKPFALSLLAFHFTFLLIFALKRWTAQEGGLLPIILGKVKTIPSPDHIITVMFTSNFIGILVCRTLHYQFYSWYFHTLPFLLWHTSYANLARVLLVLIIEYVWNQFPANAASSGALLLAHLAILLGLWLTPLPHNSQTIVKHKKQQ